MIVDICMICGDFPCKCEANYAKFNAEFNRKNNPPPVPSPHVTTAPIKDARCRACGEAFGHKPSCVTIKPTLTTPIVEARCPGCHRRHGHDEYCPTPMWVPAPNQPAVDTSTARRAPLEPTPTAMGWSPLMDDTKTTQPAAGGMKDSVGKAPWDLLDYDAVEQIVAAMEFGARKYELENWRKGISTRRLWAAAMRHLISWWKGEECASDSKVHHLGHAMANLMMIYWITKNRRQFDDRPKT